MSKMKLSEFNFDLPEELIAKYPSENRDESRLMVVHKDTGKIEHKLFKDIIDYFASIGAASNQIGRAYDYLGYLYEPSKELLMNIKNSVDPKNKMNTGTLGFKDNF